jgi:hypothetical protein
VCYTSTEVIFVIDLFPTRNADATSAINRLST